MFGRTMDNGLSNNALLNPSVVLGKQCMLHGKQLKFYCDSCEELLCYDCTVMGPHNTQLHKICNLNEAFRYRFETINKNIHESLVPKRAQLIGQIVRLDHRIDEIKTVKNVIERDIRNEYAGIMERLKSSDGTKNAILHHDMAEVQKDITRIDEILMFMEEISSSQEKQPEGVEGAPATEAPTISSGPDAVQFLHSYRHLNENIEFAVTKQFKVEIDVFPNDLPRELAERQLLMEHYEEQRKLLKFKDDVIGKLSNELKKKYDYYQEEFDKETRHEMNEWARLVDRYASELKKYEMVCAFCGQHLLDTNVNTECVDNFQIRPGMGMHTDISHSETGNALIYFTEEEPDAAVFGKRRHWFGKPSMRGYKPPTTQDMNIHVYNSLAQTKAEDTMTANPATAPILRKLQESIASQNLLSELTNRLRRLDPSNCGFIGREELVNCVFDVAQGVKATELMSLLDNYVSMFDDQQINYEEFLKMVNKGGVHQSYNVTTKESTKVGKASRDTLDRVRNSID